MITGLSHVAIRTRDIHESIRYYTGVLGLKEAFRMNAADGSLGTVYLYIAPSEYLELFVNGTRNADMGSDVIGMCHICLETADIRQAYERVKVNGGPIDSEIRVGNSKCLLFWTHDPDGNPVEIMELAPGSLHRLANERLADQTL